MRSYLISAAAVSRIEKAGCDLASVALQLSSDKRARGIGAVEGLPAEHLPLKGHALCQARRAIAENKAIKCIFITVRRADTDEVELLRVGKRGGWKRITLIWSAEGRPC